MLEAPLPVKPETAESGKPHQPNSGRTSGCHAHVEKQNLAGAGLQVSLKRPADIADRELTLCHPRRA